jgi:hypothetical protein
MRNPRDGEPLGLAVACGVVCGVSYLLWRIDSRRPRRRGEIAIVVLACVLVSGSLFAINKPMLAREMARGMHPTSGAD